MLNQYAIQFIGKVSWEGQSNGLPPEISAYLVVESEGGAAEKPFITDVIEKQVTAFFKWGAMFVQRDQGQIVDLRQTPQDRIAVPLRWIVSLSVKLHALGAELPNADENGVERLKDGSKALTH